jgi:hypothetical protein
MCNRVACVDAAGERFRNFGSRDSCRVCGRSKASAHWRDVVAPPPRAPSGARTTRPTKPTKPSPEAEKLKKLEAANKRLQEQLRAAGRGTGLDGPGHACAGAEGAVDDGAEAEKSIQTLRSRIKALEALGECPALERALVELRAQLDVEQRTKREALPPLTRVKNLDSVIKRRTEKMAKLRDNDLPDWHRAIEKANQGLESTERAINDCEQEIADLTAEKEALLRSEAQGVGPVPLRLDEQDLVVEAGRVHALIASLEGAVAHGNGQAALDRLRQTSTCLQEIVANRSNRGPAPCAGNPAAAGAQPALAGGVRERWADTRDPSAVPLGSGLDDVEFPEEMERNPLVDDDMLDVLASLDPTKRRRMEAGLARARGLLQGSPY